MIIRRFIRLTVVERTIVTIILLLIIGSIIKSAYYTISYGGVDLRERIVGARMISFGKSPYFGRWSPGQPEELINPNIIQTRAINGVTVAPGSLYILYLFSGLKYSEIRILWTIFQYLLIGYIFFFFLKNSANERIRLLIFAIGSIFFLCSSIWFLNIERGQVYIYYAFLFCLLFQLLEKRTQWAFFLAGFIIPISIYCRPTLIFSLIPILFIVNRWIITGFITSIVLLSFDFYFHLSWWNDYSTTVSYYTELPTSLRNFSSNYKFPHIIEGMNNLERYKVDFTCGGITPLNNRLSQILNLKSGFIYIVIYVCILLILIVCYYNKLREKNPAILLIFGFSLYIITEYIMPAPRGAYNLIQWIFPVFLLLKQNWLSTNLMILLLTGLLLITGYPFYLPYTHDLGEMLLIFCALKAPFSSKLHDTKVEK